MSIGAVRVGVLTGGGDCQGSMPCSAPSSARASAWGDEIVGFLDACDGRPIDQPDGVAEILASVADMGLDALI